MADTFDSRLKLRLQESGANSGQWGTLLNQTITNIASVFGFGTHQLTSDADATLTLSDDGASVDALKSSYLKITSSVSLTATRTLQFSPNTLNQVKYIENATSGSQSITISQGSGANVTIASGKTAVVYFDGAGSGAAVVDALAGVDPGVTDTLAEVLSAGNATGGTDIAVGTGDDITFADSSKAIFGAGSDLQIYHDGGNSRIVDSGTGILALQASLQLSIYNADGTQTSAEFVNNGKVGLRFSGSEKLATTSTGIDVTGVITTDGMTTSADVNFGDNDKAIFGASSDLQIYHDASHSYIVDAGTGNMYISTNGNGIVMQASLSETMFAALPNGAVSLYHNNAAKLSTTSTGIDVTGSVTASDTVLVGNGSGSSTGAVRIFGGNTSGFSNLQFADADDNNVGMIQYSHASNYMQFTTNDQERMRIDSGGNVGIGTSEIHADLHIGAASPHIDIGPSTGNRGKVGFDSNNVYIGSTSGTGEIHFKNNIGSTDAPHSSGDTKMIITDFGVGIGVVPETYLSSYRALQVGNSALIGRSGSTSETYLTANAYYDGTWKYIKTDEASVVAQSGGVISFLNAASGSADSAISWTEGMKLTSSGQLVLTVSKDDTTSDAANMNIRSSDGLVRRSTSSRRYKNTITDATHGLTELLALRPVTYKGNNDGDRLFGGLIAEEVHDAGLTEFVQYDSDDEPDALAYGHMVSLCIKAIQEQQTLIETLQAEVAALKGA